MAESSASALHARQKISAVCFARSLPLCQTTAGCAPVSADFAASRSTAPEPTGDRGTPRIDVRADRVAVVHEEQAHQGLGSVPA